MLCVSLDKRFDEGSLADAGRTHDSNDEGRGVFGKAIDEGDMEAFLADLVRNALALGWQNHLPIELTS